MPMSSDVPIHEHIEAGPFRQAVALIDSGDVEALRAHLNSHASLVSDRVNLEGMNYFSNPTLLQFVAENPIRHGRLPPNIGEVARTVLDAGGKDELDSINATLELVSSGRVSRECGVQVPLIDLLCGYGADPNEAMLAALAHGEFDAVEALIRNGAEIDLTVAAATNRVVAARETLPTASHEARHRALALAAQHGAAEIVQILIAAGEDLARFNPKGCHAHSTPLHQAALAGHLLVVRALAEAGASLEARDTLHNATPLGWAEHAEQREVAAYLRSRAAP